MTVELVDDKYMVRFMMEDAPVVLSLTRQEFEELLFKMSVLYTDNSEVACANT